MPTLLVVDDSDVSRRLVVGLLRGNSTWNVETAGNGVEALKRMAETPIDLVITDLQMPEMDGLELVRQIGARFPHSPVILMTAHGSETLAIEALEQGAASYVPKDRLADMLEETVAQVLSLAGSNRTYERLASCQRRAEFTFALENDASLIDPLVDLLQQIAFQIGLCNSHGRFGIGMAIQQALLNAIYHGNLELTHAQLEEARENLLSNPATDLVQLRRVQEPYHRRRVAIDARITPDEMHVKIVDEGPGFDVVTAQANLEDPSALTGGRGLRLMRILMDEVHFNTAGNEVTLIKRRDGQPEPQVRDEPTATVQG
jgi:CheY-like chemotaxis protein